MDDPSDSQSPKPMPGRWEGERLELSWRYAYRPEFTPLLLNYLGALPGTQILEVGSGSGFLGRLLAGSLDEAQVTAVDADGELLVTASRLVAHESLADRVRLVHGDGYRLPFPDESFDLVTSQTLL